MKKFLVIVLWVTGAALPAQVLLLEPTPLPTQRK